MPWLFGWVLLKNTASYLLALNSPKCKNTAHQKCQVVNNEQTLLLPRVNYMYINLIIPTIYMYIWLYHFYRLSAMCLTG